MGDPELRSDENLLLRTQGIFVKSIQFEGVLTNKRIILVDRAKNLLPQKEIPLVTIKDIEPGENAIRDQLITLSVLARNGETRKIILTFSRQTGGNRIRERNEWLKLLKENTSSTIDQVIRKVIPGVGPALKKAQAPVSPRVEVIKSTVSKDTPPAAKPPLREEKESVPPIKMIIESLPEPIRPSTAEKESKASEPSFGTYCSRCGNRVPEGSGFCNRCGSPIVVPGSLTPATPPSAAVPQTADYEPIVGRIQSIDEDSQTIPRIKPPGITILPDYPEQKVMQEPKNEPEIPSEQEPAATLTESLSPLSDVTISKTDEKSEPAATVNATPQAAVSPPMEGEPPAPQKPANGFGFTLDKKAVLGIIVAIIIIAVVIAAFFLFPMISENNDAAPGNGTTLPAVPTITKNSGTAVFPSETSVPTIIKNSGTAVFPAETLKPTTVSTSYPPPGNSGSRIGL